MIEQIKKILEENDFILESNKRIDATVFFKHKDEDNIDKYRHETYKHTKIKNFYCDLKDNKCRFCFGFTIKDTNSGINSNTGWLEIKNVENFISIMQCVINICNNFGKILGAD